MSDVLKNMVDFNYLLLEKYHLIQCILVRQRIQWKA